MVCVCSTETSERSYLRAIVSERPIIASYSKSRVTVEQKYCDRVWFLAQYSDRVLF